jgi:hypothetical protein
MFRVIYRIIRSVIILYGLWNAFMRSRWVAVLFALWRVLKRKPGKDVRRVAAFEFMNAHEPAIYRRRGVRRVFPLRHK